MSKTAIGRVTCLLIVGCASFTAGADEAAFSGPQAGERLPTLKVVLAYGDKQGDQIDLIAAADGKPLLLLFVNGANRPAARLTRALMNYAEMRAGDSLSGAVVWLDDDRTAAQQYLQQAISWWGIGPPVGISVDGAEGTGSYGLNRNVNVTVLVANRNRVTANFAIVQPSQTDVPAILKEVVKLIGGKVPTRAEALFLSVPTRKPANARWHAAPQDPAFRRLLCNLLAAKDDTTAMTAAHAIEQFVQDDADRGAQLTRVADMLGKGRTSVGQIPASKYLRRWRATDATEDRRRAASSAKEATVGRGVSVPVAAV